MIKNNTLPLSVQKDNIFELREGGNFQKKLILENDQPHKYAALVTGADLDLTVETSKPGSALQLFLLTPVVDGKPSKINVDLRLLHDRCHLDLTIVSLVFSDEKAEASATIYMQPNIQESGSTLLEETVILGDYVNVRNLPILDIQANNISAAHGAKIYRLDPQKLFYLQSKGLSAQQARDLLISAYPARLFEDTIEDETLKSQIIGDFLTFDHHYHHG